jgi:hypothetical protein
MSKTRPRYEALGTLRRPGEFTRPLPPSLLARVGEKAAQHEELAGRYEQATAKVQELTVELERAKRGDAERERQALKAGRQVPASKGAKVSEQFVQAEHQAAVLADVLRESAQELLQASIEHVAAAKEEAEEATAAALQESEDLGAAALAAMERASAHAAESSWLAGLALNGTAPPWTGPGKRDPSPRARGLLAMLPQAFDEDRFQAEKRREHTEREREVEEAKPLAPRTVVWREGREFVVDEKGELQEVPR